MDEIKDKIVLAVKDAIANNAESVDCDYDIVEIDCEDVDHIAEQVADTLIAAGIGDTTNLIVENEVLQRDIDNLARTLEEGTEELQEEQHRAEVAERALDKAIELAYELRTEADTLSCSSCPMFHIFDSCKDRGLYKDCAKRWKEEWIKQAEKELAEEKKDE